MQAAVCFYCFYLSQQLCECGIESRTLRSTSTQGPCSQDSRTLRCRNRPRSQGSTPVRVERREESVRYGETGRRAWTTSKPDSMLRGTSSGHLRQEQSSKLLSCKLRGPFDTFKGGHWVQQSSIFCLCYRSQDPDFPQVGERIPRSSFLAQELQLGGLSSAVSTAALSAFTAPGPGVHLSRQVAPSSTV